MSKTMNKYSPEVRERAVRLVLDNPGQHESRWGAIVSISSKIGCAPQTLNEWVKKAAGLGDAAAQYHLGIMIREGRGRAADPILARRHLETAAAQGFVAAYHPTAGAYFDAFSAAAPGEARDVALAKAYMWLSATLERSQAPTERGSATAMLEEVRAAMPARWAPALDEKVAEHLAAHEAKG